MRKDVRALDYASVEMRGVREVVLAAVQQVAAADDSCGFYPPSGVLYC